MFARQSGKRQDEAGMAIIVAVFVALFLLAVSLAYIVCSKSSLSQSHLSQGKIKGVVVAEAGMERALWYLQEKADMAGTITEGNVLGNYDELLKGYMDKDVTIKEGLVIPGMGTSTRYAARIVDEGDGNDNNGEEMAIYVIGVTRQANPMGMEASILKGMKMLVRIGARTTGMPKVTIWGPDIVEKDNSMWQIEGDIYAQNSFVQDAKTKGAPYPSSKYDQMLPGTDVVVQGPWSNTITEIDAPNIKLKRGSKEEQPPPDFNIADFSGPQGGYAGPDYTYNDLISRGWTRSGDVLVNPIGELTSIWKNPPGTGVDGTVTVLNQSESWVAKKITDNYATAEEIRKGAYYDRNGDGYTTFYLEQGDPNLRIMPFRGWTSSLWVRPEARGIIVSQGKGSNFYKSGDGISSWGKDPNTGKPYQMGADIQPNNNVSVEIRGQILGYAGTKNDAHKNIYEEKGENELYKKYVYQGKFWEDPPSELMGEQWGALSIMAENDVIISTTGIRRNDGWEDQSIFRGFIYSKRNLKIQTDILFQGQMFGIKGMDMADPGSCGQGLCKNSDGWDPSMYKEEAFNPSGGAKFLPGEFEPKKGADSRKMVILSWEADKIYKKI